MSGSPPPAAHPAQIGRYRVDKILGRGAMGVIYKAHDPAIGRDVAIKLVRADALDGPDRDAYLIRFSREAQAAGRCLHRNIVTIYDFAIHEGNPFLAMEYVEGANLADAMLRGGGFPQDEAIAIAAQVLEALSCAHGYGVVHRDIKPANVLLQANGDVKVMDFGISRLENSNLTQDGVLIGTPSYMSPEQCRGHEVDQRSDLFSVGVLLFELLSGERPFPGQSFTEVVSRLLHEEAPDLQALLGPNGVGLAAVVMRALNKRPEERFPTAAAMISALQAARSTRVEHTVFVPYTSSIAGRIAAIPPAPGPAGLDPEMLSTLQIRLAQHVGPIARVLLSSAIKKAASLEGLCDSLAEAIDSQVERKQFLADVRRDVSLQESRLDAARRTTSGSQSGLGRAGDSALRSQPGGQETAISAAVIERAQVELTRYLGPIARVLVKRALGKSATAGELWANLAVHIQLPAERAAFEAKARN